MRPKNNAVIRFLCLVAVLAVAGCNSIYYYNSDKVSLTLEGRPDPSAPVSGNLGIKKHIVLVVPSTEKPAPRSISEQEAQAKAQAAEPHVVEATKQIEIAKTQPAAAPKAFELAAEELAKAWEVIPSGDALSVISAMNFHLHPKQQGHVFGRIKVDGALITGRAAVAVANAHMADEAIGILSGQPASGVSADDRAVVCNILWDIYNILKNIDTGPAKHAKQQLAEVGRTFDMPDDVQFWVLADGKYQDKTADRLKDIDSKHDFQRLVLYRLNLNASIKTLSEMKSTKPEGAEQEMVVTQHKRMELRLNEFEQMIGRDPRVIDAVHFFCEHILFN
jgi:hypothetical protein